MKKMIILISLIVVFFAILIGGILMYAKELHNPTPYEFKPATMQLNLNDIKLEKKVVSGNSKLEITNVALENDRMTIYTENNLHFQVFGIPVRAIHSHEETEEVLEEQYYNANFYFDVRDEKGTLINDPNIAIMEMEGKQGFVIEAMKPEEGNKIIIKLYERTTNTLVGEQTVQVCK